MIKIGICDDNKKSVVIIEEKLRKLLEQRQQEYKIQTYQSSEYLLYDIREGVYFDLLCLDVEMPKVTGIDLAKEIKEHIPNALVILITSYLNYAVDGYEVPVFRFVLKKDLDAKLLTALDDALTYREMQSSKQYTIITQTKLDRIDHKNIVYIYKQGKNCIIVTDTGEEKSVRKSLKQVFDELDHPNFVFTDRGYVVNISHIRTITKFFAKSTDGQSIPISGSHLKNVKKELAAFWGNMV